MHKKGQVTLSFFVLFSRYCRLLPHISQAARSGFSVSAPGRACSRTSAGLSATSAGNLTCPAQHTPHAQSHICDGRADAQPDNPVHAALLFCASSQPETHFSRRKGLQARFRYNKCAAEKCHETWRLSRLLKTAFIINIVSPASASPCCPGPRLWLPTRCRQ